MSVNIGGKIYRNLPEQVKANMDNVARIFEAMAEFGDVMRYKGSVPTYVDLPTEDNKVGDVWNVLDTGNNYAWDGEAWDEISSIVDLTGYALKANITSIYDETLTYALGAIVYYEDSLYKANVAITTPEAWDATHWNAITIAGELASIRSDVALKANDADVMHLTGDETVNGNKTWGRYGTTNESYRIVFIGPYSTVNIFVRNFNLVLGASILFTGNIFSAQNNNYADLGSSGIKFKDFYLAGSINLGTSGIMKYENGVFTVNDDFTPAVTDNYDLGSSTVAWRHLYLSGAINPNSDGYGLKFPSTSGWTADKTVATLDDIPAPSGWNSFDLSHVTNVAASTVTTGVYLVGISLDTDLSAVAKAVSVKANNGIIYPAFIGISFLQIFCNTNLSIGGIDSIYYM